MTVRDEDLDYDRHRWAYTPTGTYQGCRVCGRQPDNSRGSESFYYDRPASTVMCPECFRVIADRKAT